MVRLSQPETYPQVYPGAEEAAGGKREEEGEI
jgi:hypothetical protein